MDNLRFAKDLARTFSVQSVGSLPLVLRADNYDNNSSGNSSINGPKQANNTLCNNMELLELDVHGVFHNILSLVTT